MRVEQRGRVACVAWSEWKAWAVEGHVRGWVECGWAGVGGLS